MAKLAAMQNHRFVQLKSAVRRVLDRVGPAKRRPQGDEKPRKPSRRRRLSLSRVKRKDQAAAQTDDHVYESAAPEAAAGVATTTIVSRPQSPATEITPATTPAGVPTASILPATVPPVPSHTGTGLSATGPERTETTVSSSTHSTQPSRKSTLSSSSTSLSTSSTSSSSTARTGTIRAFIQSLRKPKRNMDSPTISDEGAQKQSTQSEVDVVNPPALTRERMGTLPTVTEENGDNATVKQKAVMTPAATTPVPLSTPGVNWVPEFVKIWESTTLHELEESLENMYDGDYVISVHPGPGKQPESCVAEIMTPEELPQPRNSLEKSLDTLPSHLRGKIHLEYRIGTIERTMDRLSSDDLGAGPSSRSVPHQDTFSSTTSSEGPTHAPEYASPVNAHKYEQPYMGDSAGWLDDDNSAATLGPMVRTKGLKGWLVNWHTFNNESSAILEYDHHEGQPPRGLCLVHPGPQDYPAPVPSTPDPSEFVSLGKVVAFSGRMNQTSRGSRTMKLQCGYEKEVKTITDWAIVHDTDSTAEELEYCPNKLRTVPSNRDVEEFTDDVVETMSASQRISRRIVRSTGRSSGYSYARVCMTPASHRLNGVKCMDWFVEPDKDEGQYLHDDERVKWNRNGPGVEGDSGAPIVDFETGKLIGMIWGRLKKKGSPVRHGLFTHIADLFDDVEERYPQLGRPDLQVKKQCESTTKPLPWLEDNDGHGQGTPDGQNANAAGEQQADVLHLPSTGRSRASSIRTQAATRSSSKASSEKTEVEFGEPLDRRLHRSLSKVEENLDCMAIAQPKEKRTYPLA